MTGSIFIPQLSAVVFRPHPDTPVGDPGGAPFPVEWVTRFSPQPDDGGRDGTLSVESNDSSYADRLPLWSKWDVEATFDMGGSERREVYEKYQVVFCRTEAAAGKPLRLLAILAAPPR